MKDTPSTMSSDRIAPVTETLIETLREEADALEELVSLFEGQLEALRAGDAQALAEMATKAQKCTSTLESKRQEARRQARLLRRVLDAPADASLRDLVERLKARPDQAVGKRLAEVHDTVTDHAAAVTDRSEALSFALQYAADLNHELLAAMQGADEEENVHAYTATGQAASPHASDDRSFVNTIG